MGSHDDLLPDDVLELVLLGLHSPLWLLRAASTCKRWRRLISDAGFLRRFRALHNRAPIIVDTYRNVRPRLLPSPSAGVDALHFSLDFLPGNGDTHSWEAMDSRGSLLLIYFEEFRTGRKDLIVCEPLTRRHEMIPLPSTTPVDDIGWSTTAVLLDGDGGIGMSSFRVLCVVQVGNRILASMFTSGSSSWLETMETLEVKQLLGRQDFLPDYYRISYPLEFPWPPSLRACCVDESRISVVTERKFRNVL